MAVVKVVINFHELCLTCSFTPDGAVYTVFTVLSPISLQAWLSFKVSWGPWPKDLWLIFAL